MKKKAQIQAEVFIYILAVVITGAILLFGYVAIRDFVKRGEDAEFIKLKTSMERDVSDIRGDFGTVRIKEYQIPTKYNKVCLVGENPDVNSITNAVIKDSVASGVQKNVFFLPDGTDSIYVGRIDMPDTASDFQCFNVVQGIIRLRLEGRGDQTWISQAG